MDIVDKGIKMETLTLSQLKKRLGWEGYSLDNIYQFAEEGHFGLYVNVSNVIKSSNIKTYCSIDDYINTLVSSQYIDSVEKSMYLELKNKFEILCKKYAFLLEEKQGYERFSISKEVEIFALCSNGSVFELRHKLNITGSEFNNYFGFRIRNGKCISPAYYFNKKLINCEKIKKEVLIVFIDQIEKFEKNFSYIAEPHIINECNSFVRKADYYSITFNRNNILLKVSKGLQYIEVLLKNPFKKISVIELYNVVNTPHVVNQIDSNLLDLEDEMLHEENAYSKQPVMDKQTMLAVKNRLEELEHMKHTAKEDDNIEEEQECQEEIEKLRNHMDKSSFKNKSNSFNNDSDSCRSSIKQAISSCIEKVKKSLPELSEYLIKTIKTGSSCTYWPKEKIRW